MEEKKPLVIKLESEDKYLRLLEGQPQTAGMRSGLVLLKPGEEIGEHSTGNREESLVILSGEAQIYCAGYPVFTASAASLVYIPPHTTHNVKNAGKSPVKYVYIVSPV
ncbi:MAG: cupin domain-containing protein [Candidatus Omnitrophota bacterium]